MSGGGMDSGGADEVKIDASVWLTSYGDLLTILLVFFLIMVSPQSVTSEKKSESKKELDSAISSLSTELKQEKISENVDVVVTGNSAVISMQDKLIFDQGSATLSPDNKQRLQKIARTLASVVKTHRIAIEGHTDNIPINKGVFKSNWYLSSYRALSVLDVFIEVGVPEDVLTAQGFGQFKPLVPNTDKEGKDLPENRSKNRRVDLRIY